MSTMMTWADASAAIDNREIVRRKLWAPTVNIRRNERGGLIYAGTRRPFIATPEDKRATDWEVFVVPASKAGQPRGKAPRMSEPRAFWVTDKRVADAVVSCIQVAREVSTEAGRFKAMRKGERDAFLAKLRCLDEVMDDAVAAKSNRRWLVPFVEHGGVHV